MKVTGISARLIGAQAVCSGGETKVPMIKCISEQKAVSTLKSDGSMCWARCPMWSRSPVVLMLCNYID